jgi:hypothetical protein
MRQLTVNQCSVISLLAGPAQYALVWIVVTWLSRHGLWEVHTWKENLAIQIYLVGAIASIWLAGTAMRRGLGTPRWWAWLALTLSLANLFPTAIVAMGW